MLLALAAASRPQRIKKRDFSEEAEIKRIGTAPHWPAAIPKMKMDTSPVLPGIFYY